MRMALEGLASAQSRIAEIQSQFTATGSTIRSVGGSVGGSTGAASSTAGATTSLPAVGSTTTPTFSDLLAQYGGAQGALGNGSGSATSALAQLTDLMPRTGSTAAQSSQLPTGTNASRGERFTTFAQDVLSSIGAQATPENIRGIKAWALAEGTAAANNPLATTRHDANTTDFNSVGVKNYPSYAEGVEATAATLKNGRYQNILAAFADGSSAERIAAAVANSPWGTGQGVTRILHSGTV